MISGAASLFFMSARQLPIRIRYKYLYCGNVVDADLLFVTRTKQYGKFCDDAPPDVRGKWFSTLTRASMLLKPIRTNGWGLWYYAVDDDKYIHLRALKKRVGTFLNPEEKPHIEPCYSKAIPTNELVDVMRRDYTTPYVGELQRHLGRNNRTYKGKGRQRSWKAYHTAYTLSVFLGLTSSLSNVEILTGAGDTIRVNEIYKTLTSEFASLFYPVRAQIFRSLPYEYHLSAWLLLHPNVRLRCSDVDPLLAPLVDHDTLTTHPLTVRDKFVNDIPVDQIIMSLKNKANISKGYLFGSCHVMLKNLLHSSPASKE